MLHQGGCVGRVSIWGSLGSAALLHGKGDRNASAASLEGHRISRRFHWIHALSEPGKQEKRFDDLR